MSNNPLDFLNKNPNAGWQDLSSAYFSRSKKMNKKGLLAAGLLSFLNVKEQRMINDSNRSLRTLANEQITEQAKALKLWEDHEKVAQDHKSYLDNKDYFVTLAEKEWETANANFDQSQFGLGGRSVAGSAVRETEIKEKADYLKNEHFLRMNYKPIKETGKFDYDEVTRLPKRVLQTNKEDASENIRNIHLTKEEFNKPFNDYILAKQERILDPANRSWGLKGVNKIKNLFGYDSETMVLDPEAVDKDTGKQSGKKISLIALEQRANARKINTASFFTKLSNEQIVTNDTLIKAAPIVRYRDIYELEKKDAKGATNIARKAIFQFGKDEAILRATELTRGMEEGVQKAVLQAIQNDTKTDFSLKDLENRITSTVITNNVMANKISSWKNTFDKNYLEQNKVLDFKGNEIGNAEKLRVWAQEEMPDTSKMLPKDKKAALIAEVQKQAYNDNRRNGVDRQLGVIDEFTNNIAKINKLKLIVENKSDFSDQEFKLAQKELIDMSTTTLETALLSAVARDMYDEKQIASRTTMSKERQEVDINGRTEQEVGDGWIKDRVEVGHRVVKKDSEGVATYQWLQTDAEWALHMYEQYMGVVLTLAKTE